MGQARTGHPHSFRIDLSSSDHTGRERRDKDKAQKDKYIISVASQSLVQDWTRAISAASMAHLQHLVDGSQFARRQRVRHEDHEDEQPPCPEPEHEPAIMALLDIATSQLHDRVVPACTLEWVSPTPFEEPCSEALPALIASIQLQLGLSGEPSLEGEDNMLLSLEVFDTEFEEWCLAESIEELRPYLYELSSPSAAKEATRPAARVRVAHPSVGTCNKAKSETADERRKRLDAEAERDVSDDPVFGEFADLLNLLDDESEATSTHPNRNWSAIPELDAILSEVAKQVLADSCRCLPESTVLAVRSALGRDKAQELLVSECSMLLECERATIFLRDVLRDELVTRASVGNVVIRIPRSSGIAGASATTGEHIVSNDAISDSRFDQTSDQASGFVTRSIMSTPIRNPNGVVVGVLQLINKAGQFGTCDTTLAARLATLAGATLTHSVSLSKGQNSGFVKMVPDAEDAAQYLSVAVPNGIKAGQLMYVTTPQGNEVEVTLPDGVRAGELFEVYVGEIDAMSPNDNVLGADFTTEEHSGDESNVDTILTSFAAEMGALLD